MMSPSTDQGRVVVFGLMFDLPYAGIVAQFLHYLLGLRALGWDVWYVEDSLSWPYDPQTRTSALDPAEGIGRIASVLEKYGFGNRWIYRCAVPGTTVFGTASETLAEIYQTADLALNVTGAQVLRDEHRALRRLVYVQSDPFALQVDIDNGNRWAEEQLARHHVHFTFGELIGTPSCALPTVGHRWLPTRQPVALELWPVQPIGDRFTTVTTWHSTAKPKLWRGSQ